MTYVYLIKIDTEIDEKEDKQNLRACLLQRLAFVLLATDLRPCCPHSPEAHDTVFYLRLNYGMLINVKINKTSHRVNIHLRNEFHFSGVHGAMNRSGSRAK